MPTDTSYQWFEAAANNDVPKLRKFEYRNSKSLDKEGRSALMHAAATGAVDAIKFLLEEEKDTKGPYNWTALMEAAAHNYIRSIELLGPHIYNYRLLERHPIYKPLTTALHIAAYKGNTQAVSLLLSEADASGWVPMHVSAYFYNLGDILYNYYQPVQVDLLKRSPVFYAVFAHPSRQAEFSEYRSYTQSIRALCCLPNALDYPLDCYGKSPLHYAVEINNIIAVKALCKYYCMIGTSRACRTYPVNTTALMLAVLFENVEAAAILAKYEHGAKDENGLPAIHFAGQIKNVDIRKQMLDILYYRERQILIKRQLNGKLDVSTFEHNLSIEESHTLYMSSKVQEDFNSILENVTEDNRDRVCEYLCQKLSKSYLSRSKIQNPDDLSVSSLFSKNIDTMHEIINGILDVLLEKSVVSYRMAASTIMMSADQAVSYLEIPGTKETYYKAQQLLKLNEQLLEENAALKNSIKDITNKYGDLEYLTYSKGVGSFLIDAVNSLEFSTHSDIYSSKVHQDPQKSQIRMPYADSSNDFTTSTQMLQSQLNEAQIEIYRLFEENEALKKQPYRNENQITQFSDSTLKMSNDLSISQDRQNPFKHQEVVEQPSYPESLFSADRNVFLSINSASSTQNPLGELNRRLSDLEIYNRQLNEDIKINVIMYEERIRQMAEQYKQLQEENAKMTREMNSIIDENVEKSQQIEGLKMAIEHCEMECYNDKYDYRYFSELILRMKSDIAMYESDKQYMAEYITDVVNELIEMREKRVPAQAPDVYAVSPNVDCYNSAEAIVNMETAIQTKDDALKKVIQLQGIVEQQQATISRLQKQITQQTEGIMNLDQISKLLDAEVKEVVESIALKYNATVDQDLPPIKQLHQVIQRLDELLHESNTRMRGYDQKFNDFMQALQKQGYQFYYSVSQTKYEDALELPLGQEMDGV